jgi:hypothetical protein
LRYQFEWDPKKDRINRRKHGLSFALATTIFQDPNQLSIFDETHSGREDRWITMGLDGSGKLRVVVHTFKSASEELSNIRIISARSAEPEEQAQYLEQNK